MIFDKRPSNLKVIYIIIAVLTWEIHYVMCDFINIFPTQLTLSLERSAFKEIDVYYEFKANSNFYYLHIYLCK